MWKRIFKHEVGYRHVNKPRQQPFVTWRSDIQWGDSGKRYSKYPTTAPEFASYNSEVAFRSKWLYLLKYAVYFLAPWYMFVDGRWKRTENMSCLVRSSFHFSAIFATTLKYFLYSMFLDWLKKNLLFNFLEYFILDDLLCLFSDP